MMAHGRSTLPVRTSVPLLACFICIAVAYSQDLAIERISTESEPASPSESPRTFSSEEHDFFEKQVRPLLVKRCFECHAGTKAGGGLSLETAKAWQTGGESGQVIVPGQPNESLLIDAINYRNLEMPPADHGGKLSDREIEVLTRWVQKGAPDPRDGRDVLGGMSRQDAENWWAFQPLPDLSGTRGELTIDARRIDDLLQREMVARPLTLAPPADRRTLLRRLSYGLTGLPPTAEEVDAFVADDSSDAWSQVVERLLDSPQYGVHWGRHWLDVVRYADTAGENTDRPLPHAWRYRNWVFKSFQTDQPFDQFVRMQLAGDQLTHEMTGAERSDGIVATGYLAIARRFGHDIDKDMYLTYEDVIDNLGKNFLGLTLGCARCHDHKYDPISSEDYYALYGIFDSTCFAFPGCEPKGQPRDLVPLLTQAEIDALMQPWQERLAQIEAEKKHRQESIQSAQQQITPYWASSKQVLEESKVAEGGSAEFQRVLTVRRGELMLLSVMPNENHGADSTLIEWTIRETTGAQRIWSVLDLVPELMKGNPWLKQDDASWSFLETTSTPVFLNEQHDSISGRTELNSWSLGSEPSVFVNSASEPVPVWSTLPARSFFVHPGPGRPVSVAWTSPIDGEVLVSGRVADAHPAGLDGVSYELSHIASPDLGTALADLGSASTGLPDVGSPPVIPVAYAVVDGETKNTRMHQRGDPEKLGEQVPRRWLTVLGGMEVPNNAGSGRRELSEWVSRHPLAARVMVNRIWEWHFGHGLVRSPNDFGSRGEPPTHPELLDFLAAKFVQSGYSIKEMHRLIVQTKAYRRASATPAIADSENRWLAHFSRRRLTAEELRDSLLAVSGQLDKSSAEGHPFPDERSWNFTQHAPFHAVYETNRRSVYLMVQRQRRHPFLALFDGADPNASTPSRQTTTVPTQALYFINDPFFHSQAKSLAETLLEKSPEEARLLQVYRLLFQREPTTAEMARLQEFRQNYPGGPEERWAALARVLMASNEFLYVD